MDEPVLTRIDVVFLAEQAASNVRQGGPEAVEAVSQQLRNWLAGERHRAIATNLQELARSLGEALQGGTDGKTPDALKNVDGDVLSSLQAQGQRFLAAGTHGIPDEQLEAIVTRMLRSLEERREPEGGSWRRPARGGTATALLGLAAAVWGFTDQGWPGAATGLVTVWIVSVGLHVLFGTKLGTDSGVVSAQSTTGRVQRVAGLFVAIGGMLGAWLGGWTWGWSWSIAAGVLGFMLGGLLGKAVFGAKTSS